MGRRIRRGDGDVASGGNWFSLVNHHALRIAFDNIERLTDCTWRIRQALERDQITGDGGHQIDHIELFGPPESRFRDADP